MFEGEPPEMVPATKKLFLPLFFSKVGKKRLAYSSLFLEKLIDGFKKNGVRWNLIKVFGVKATDTEIYQSVVFSLDNFEGMAGATVEWLAEGDFFQMAHGCPFDVSIGGSVILEMGMSEIFGRVFESGNGGEPGGKILLQFV